MKSLRNRKLYTNPNCKSVHIRIKFHNPSGNNFDSNFNPYEVKTIYAIRILSCLDSKTKIEFGNWTITILTLALIL